MMSSDRTHHDDEHDEGQPSAPPPADTPKDPAKDTPRKKRSMRGWGEGSIVEGKDGRWRGALRLPDGTRKYVRGGTKTEVKRKLQALAADVEQGLPTGDERLTVESWLVSWLESVQPPTLDYATWRSYAGHIRRLLPSLGRTRLKQLTAQQVQAAYSERLASGLSATTVRHMHSTLHQAIARAVTLGLVARNVTELVQLPRRTHADIHPLGAEETRALLAVTGETRLAAWYLVAITTGMRQSELVGLRWSEVDLPERRVQVRWQLKREAGQWVWKQPKTRRSRRQIALCAEAVTALRAWRARQAAERLRLGDAWGNGQDWGELVFTSEAGTPLMSGNIRRHLARMLQAAGLPYVRFHDLRHTCATLLLAARVNPKVVSELLGHTSVAFTLDTYAHVLPDMQQDAAAAMDRLVAVAVRALAEAVTDDYERTGEGGSQHD